MHLITNEGDNSFDYFLIIEIGNILMIYRRL